MRRLLSLIAVVAAALAVTGGALAAQGPPPGHGPGGEGETLGNNLSVPAIFVPSATGAPALRIGCPNSGVAPSGPTTTYDGVAYWLQKTDATWSAECALASSATVTAQWGANLTDAPTVAAGQPVRVEVGLLDPAASGRTGYVITNLTPDAPDRDAVYGTDGATFTTGTDPATQTLTRVWTSGAMLKIEKRATDGSYTTIYDASMTAEINSTGAVVYGYNWGTKGRANTPVAGTYRLTFSVPAASGVTIDGVMPGTVTEPSSTDYTTSVVVTLTSSHGGGGR